MSVPLEDLLAHAGWLRGLATRLVRDAAAADDLVQETWMAALRRPPQADRPVRPWLLGVVRNLARQRFRSESRRHRREERAAVPEENALPTPDELAERLETQRLLAGVVAELDEPFRSTVLLRYWEGLSAADIARRTGVPAGTVRWRLKRGLDDLRDRLDRRHGGDRRAWALALVPLAGEPSGPVPLAGAPATATAAALGGVTLMATLGKVALAGGAVVAAALGLWVMEVGPFASPAALPRDPVDVSFRPLSSPAPADPGEVTGRPAATDEAGTGGSARTTEPIGPDTTTAPAVAVITARAVDPDGAPIGNARFTGRDAEQRVTATAGGDGRVRFEMPVPFENWDVTVVVSAPGFATVVVDTHVTRDATTPLGDVTLVRGGAVSGRVTLPDGSPLAGAWVGVADAGSLLGEWEKHRLWGPEALIQGASTETRVDGTFTLDGVPAGVQRLWAGKSDHRGTLTGPIEVRAATESYGVAITVAPMALEDRITGRVVAPDGTPVAGAALRVEYSAAGGNSGMSTDYAEEDGTFRVLVNEPAVYRITATDDEGRWGGVTVEDVQPGTLDLELRLPEARFTDLLVTSADGPVTRYEVSVIHATEPILLDHHGLDERPDGRLRFRVPAQPYRVTVEAPGHTLGELGPLDAERTPERLTVMLETLPGIHGVVTGGDGPVAGATVILQRMLEPGHRWTHNGFDILRETERHAQVTTDADGAFRVTVRERGRWVLRIEADGYAPAEVGPWDIDPRSGRPDVAVALDQGGVIDGVVRVPAGREPAGIIIGASRADGHATTVRTDAEGRFRFERCIPGRWEVRVTDEEILRSRSTTKTTDGEPRIDWNCVVRSGAATPFELRLDGATDRRVTGLLDLGATSPLGWRATLAPGGPDFEAPDQDPVAVDGDGRFALSTPSDGPHRIVLVAPEGDLWILGEVRVAGAETAWSESVALGRVAGTNARAGDRPGQPGLALVWEGVGGLWAMAPVNAAEDGTFVVERAPAGRCRVVVPDRRASRDPRQWETLATVDVVEGETVSVDLP